MIYASDVYRAPTTFRIRHGFALASAATLLLWDEAETTRRLKHRALQTLSPRPMFDLIPGILKSRLQLTNCPIEKEEGVVEI